MVSYIQLGSPERQDVFQKVQQSHAHDQTQPFQPPDCSRSLLLPLYHAPRVTSSSGPGPSAIHSLRWGLCNLPVPTPLCMGFRHTNGTPTASLSCQSWRQCSFSSTLMKMTTCLQHPAPSWETQTFHRSCFCRRRICEMFAFPRKLFFQSSSANTHWALFIY